ncbi:ABC transporter ATP-binding protein [Mobiluncus mulieris]|uniref:ABC transporter ATP-binding protein n=1 Tax=Mobiluncus mulieris TaxID=2052 RepID=UPI000E088B86|nr:ABC transporter ATP-binding protein [Mobiluncus mulieris]MCU9973357.1 ABC transporter ATP-binding protein [Mobiluncus mulieris]MCV0008877.1 ABC transporter ATP-binding protein [Mobiluncus mulieris]STY83322.1 Maltose/maltodextrin import ATP-binding protein MalK [Mobiluncus mulieris]
MPEITLTDITKRWGTFFAVDHLNLKIEDNAFITLLGPSGCGKTTILRMIAGLETPTSGQIKIGDRVVFDSKAGINVPANKRRVGFLFQNYALWPNMTVQQNITFGLSNVKEEMPTRDEEAKLVSDEIRILTTPKKLLELLEECRNKKGELDAQRAVLAIIDAFTVSHFTAKRVFDKHYEKQGEAAVSARCKSLCEHLDGIVARHEAAGEKLGKEFEIIKNGTPVTSVRKYTKEETDMILRRVSRVVKIGMFMDRYPAELSGGQQQRVAIARTLAPEPHVLFMDEPLSNLDAKLRLEMRYELQRLHVETGSTFVYVTHDQMEAMTLATKICLLNNGVLQQYDAPLNVYNNPKNLFSADFVGSPSINFIDAKGTQDGQGKLNLELLDGLKAVFTPRDPLDLGAWQNERDAQIKEKQQSHALEMQDRKAVEKSNKDEFFNYHIAKVDETVFDPEEHLPTDEDFVVGVRPEYLEISDDGALEAEIYGAMPTGMETTLKLRIGEYLLTGVMFGSNTYQLGETEKLSFKGNNILLFDRKSGRLITVGSLSFS